MSIHKQHNLQKKERNPQNMKKKYKVCSKICKSHKEKYLFTLMAQHARKEEYVIHAVIENTQITSKETDIYSAFSCIKRH